MRTNTDGVRPYINKPTHQSVDDLIADLSRGICFPQPALQVDVIATERELGQAAGALKNMATTEKIRIEIVDQGAVDPLVKCIKGQCDFVKGMAADCLGELAINIRNRDIIAQGGAIPPLVGILRHFAAPPDEDYSTYVDEFGKVRSIGSEKPTLKTVERVCRALRRLALNAKNAIELGHNGAMKPLLFVMEHVDSAETRSQSGNTLVSMAATEEYRNKIGRLDAIPAFQKFLKSIGHDTLMAACALKNLVWNEPNKHMMAHKQGIPQLVDILASGPTRAAEKCATSLCHIAECREHLKDVVDAKAITALIPHLHSEDIRLKLAAVRLLEILHSAMDVEQYKLCAQQLMLMLRKEAMWKERILATSCLGHLASAGGEHSDEMKIAICASAVELLHLEPRERKRQIEFKRKRAIKREQMRISKSLTSYRQWKADAAQRVMELRFKANTEMRMYFSRPEINAFREQFKAIDMDKSGQIDENELKALLITLGEKPGQGKRAARLFNKRVRRLIHEVDVDKTGTVDFNEYLAIMKDLREGKGGALAKVMKRAALGGYLGRMSSSIKSFFAKNRRAVPVQGTVGLLRVRLRKVTVQVSNVVNLGTNEKAKKSHFKKKGTTDEEPKRAEYDVYCRLFWCDRPIGKTIVVKNTREDVVFDGDTKPMQKFDFLLPEDCDNLDLRVEVWDEDFGKDDFLGEIYVDADELLETRAENKDYELVKKAGMSHKQSRHICGSVGLKWVVHTEGGGGERTNALLNFGVMIDCANNLAVTDVGKKKGAGMADAYAKVMLISGKGEERKALGKTDTIKNSLNPQWENAIFEVRLPDVHKDPELNIEDVKLLVEVFDDDFGKDDFLGQVELNGRELMMLTKEKQDFSLKERPYAKPKIFQVPKVVVPEETPTPGGPGGAAGPYAQLTNGPAAGGAGAFGGGAFGGGGGTGGGPSGGKAKWGVLSKMNKPGAGGNITAEVSAVGAFGASIPKGVGTAVGEYESFRTKVAKVVAVRKRREKMSSAISIMSEDDEVKARQAAASTGFAAKMRALAAAKEKALEENRSSPQTSPQKALTTGSPGSGQRSGRRGSGQSEYDDRGDADDEASEYEYEDDETLVEVYSLANRGGDSDAEFEEEYEYDDYDEYEYEYSDGDGEYSDGEYDEYEYEYTEGEGEQPGGGVLQSIDEYLEGSVTSRSNVSATGSELSTGSGVSMASSSYSDPGSQRAQAAEKREERALARAADVDPNDDSPLTPRRPQTAEELLGRPLTSEDKGKMTEFLKKKAELRLAALKKAKALEEGVEYSDDELLTETDAYTDAYTENEEDGEDRGKRQRGSSAGRKGSRIPSVGRKRKKGTRKFRVVQGKRLGDDHSGDRPRSGKRKHKLVIQVKKEVPREKTAEEKQAEKEAEEAKEMARQRKVREDRIKAEKDAKLKAEAEEKARGDAEEQAKKDAEEQARKNAMSAEEREREREHECVRKLQGMWRKKKAIQNIRMMCASVYEKLFDPASGTHYYYNTNTGEAQWTKPVSLGNLEIEEGEKQIADEEEKEFNKVKMAEKYDDKGGKFGVPFAIREAFTHEELYAFQEKFVQFDADASGHIDKFELRTLLMALVGGDLPSMEEVMSMMRQVDEDDSGFVDFGEFVTLVHMRKNERDRRRTEQAKKARGERRTALDDDTSESEGSDSQDYSDESDSVSEDESGSDDDHEAEPGEEGTDQKTAKAKRNAKKKAKREAKKAKEAAELESSDDEDAADLDAYPIDPELAKEFEEEEIKDFRKQFKRFDVDHSGELAEDELKALFEEHGDELSQEQLEKMVAEVDLDGTGSVDFCEYVGMLHKRLYDDDPNEVIDGADSEEYESEEDDSDDETYRVDLEVEAYFTDQQLSDFKKQFKQIDDDKSGHLDEDEMKMLIDALGIPADRNKVHEMMEEIDVDGTGSIDFNEFVTMMHDMHRGKGSALGRMLQHAGLNGVFGPVLGLFMKRQKANSMDFVAEQGRSEYRKERLEAAEREKKESLEVLRDRGPVPLLVEMLDQEIEDAKEKALGMMLELCTHEKCAKLVVDSGGIKPLVRLKQTSRNEVEEEMASAVLYAIASMREEWADAIDWEELSEKERWRIEYNKKKWDYIPPDLERVFKPAEIIQFKKTFEMIDEDGSHEIDEQELGTLLASFGEKPKPYKLKKMMAQVDQDESGSLNFEEFVWMMKEIKDGHYNAFGAVMKRALVNGALAPFVAIGKMAGDVQEWLDADKIAVARRELINEVRRRISLADESIDQIMDTLSKEDRQIVKDEGISKWT
jgi:Ca2+-binding EF-hand superfamily protein